jgi:type II secretory pathway pseudopilin PulG
MGDRYNLLFDKNAVSELVGYLILVSVAVTVIGITYAMTMPQITDSQNQATFQSVEQAFTVLDTHMSKSQYSNDLSQLTEMKLNGGKLAVDDNEGTITINFKNYAHNPVYTGKLGTIIYTLNGREVGYEGGGIWERYSDSGSAMISAPDFNYNGETLTLPLMQIKDGDTNSKSSESTTGSVYITSKSEPTPEPIYPNDKYLGETTRQINPVKADEVTVIIKSRYYQAWANYINSNTDGHATINPATQEVTVTFYTRLPGEKRPFRQHEPIEIRGLNYNNHDPLSAFYLDLNGAKSKMQVDLKAPADNSPIPGTNPALRISFKKEGGLGLMGTTVTVEYTENGKVETFEADVQALINPDETAHIDLLNTGATTEYTSNSDSWTWVSDGKTYTKHDDPTTYPDLETVLQHYIRLMGEKYHGSYSLYKSDDGGQHWPADSSTYTLDYDADNVLTYMHITNNPITVTLG